MYISICVYIFYECIRVYTVNKGRHGQPSQYPRASLAPSFLNSQQGAAQLRNQLKMRDLGCRLRETYGCSQSNAKPSKGW